MRSLAGKRILLGVTGGIGAYKAAIVARQLVQAQAVVDVVLTRGATQFIGAATFAGITGRRVRTEVWEDIADDTHVALGRAAEAVLVYPATAHTLARFAQGFADDLLTTALLVARCPIVVAPAMHTEMWTHQATQDNIARLRDRGITVAGPDDGELMGGDTGPGRLIEPQLAVRAVADMLVDDPATSIGPTAGPLVGRQVIVTAAGTREIIDPVRFIGNRSTGKMGFALAHACANAGATVTLITGPTELATPTGVTARVDVESADDMYEAVMDRFDNADIIIKAAAVADFRPTIRSQHKIKKHGAAPVIELAPTRDILAECGKRRNGARHPILVGFAAETDDVRRNAVDKIAAKQADLLVVNDVSRSDAGFAVDTNEVALLDRDGDWTELPASSKLAIAQVIVDEIVRRFVSDR
ncbi:MAG: bifunctional phosphopantothenoylcysteine decarboxylase/phosphopantothenate--cysteine ligase CoaBC [Nitriliruptoraceae bacterium]